MIVSCSDHAAKGKYRTMLVAPSADMPRTVNGGANGVLLHVCSDQSIQMVHFSPSSSDSFTSRGPRL